MIQILRWITGHLYTIQRYSDDESLSEVQELDFTYTKSVGHYVGWHIVNCLLFYVLPLAIICWAR